MIRFIFFVWIVIGFRRECHSIGIYDLSHISIVQFPSGAVVTPPRNALHMLSDVLLQRTQRGIYFDLISGFHQFLSHSIRYVL